ncbi:hypothetical protein LWP59_30850 [Amycolatopsis acidiphila]|uniref:TetR/AcrR family transcriptional regulator n=1 Tax=Amycolatopsis acidiphila TaxID=715473 RepID=A0A557ZSY8_9PSEU|nr:hypothetical protein [Amycolatopsis acidiphila]TVT15147.1 hypothetical protein FNH06_36635 [Amycolatopsis acidiphila]UIJ58475.1 hypothetical protein LWP59_30850 [Amycolatopsis acidiphila]GHG77304.1 hypothetical protein GCM10017788_43550 [Amycolatopsis acidiphila]
MGWNDFYQRRDIADAVLRRAARDPRAPLPFAEIPGAVEAFGTEEQLLLALHYRWSQLLGGHLRTEFEDATDHVDAVTRAWRETVRKHRTLRAVLDANVDRYPALRQVHEAEQRMLAVAAGLAEPGEPVEEITKVGAAFTGLLRHGPDIEAPRRNPIGQLLRMLAPSA